MKQKNRNEEVEEIERKVKPNKLVEELTELIYTALRNWDINFMTKGFAEELAKEIKQKISKNWIEKKEIMEFIKNNRNMFWINQNTKELCFGQLIIGKIKIEK